MPEVLNEPSPTTSESDDRRLTREQSTVERSGGGRWPRGGTASNLWLFLLPTSIWGTTWLVIKYQLGTVAPEVSVAWRFALAAVLLLGWCVWRRTPLRYGPRAHMRFATLGVLLFGLNYVLVYRAEATLTSGLVAVLFSFLVLWNLLGARLFLGTRAPMGLLFGAVLGVAGVGLLFWPDLSGQRADSGLLVGVGYAVAGTLVASAGNLYSQRLFARDVAIVPATAFAMGYAAVSLLIWCAVNGISFSFDPRPRYVLSLLYLALFGSVVAFVAYLTLLKRIGAGRAGYSAAAIPAVAMLASTLFEHYRWTALGIAGMALVLVGSVLVLRAKERATRH